MNLYIDIETIPTQRADVKSQIAETIKPPGNIKKPESIDKWMAEKGPSAIDEAWRKTALNGTFGELFCIGFAFDLEAPQIIYRALDGSEKELLEEFFNVLHDKVHAIPGKPQPLRWIGHYITGFDLRFIWQRAVINQVPLTVKIPYDAKPWSDQVYDTKIEWTGNQSTGFGSAADVALALGLSGKTEGMDGSKVWDYVRDGLYGEACEYCQQDVIITRGMHLRQTFDPDFGHAIDDN
jgi:hypothetical protein